MSCGGGTVSRTRECLDGPRGDVISSSRCDGDDEEDGIACETQTCPCKS